MSEPRPFTVAVPDEVLADLDERLARFRPAPDHHNADGAYGFRGDLLAELVDHWRTGYDWRRVEGQLNRLENFVVELDDVPIHYVHRRGEQPGSTPVLLSHGWPGSFWDFREVVARLTQPSRFGREGARSFDVIVPSLPGFDFSGPVTEGVGYLRTADLFVRLMVDVLGYDRFAAHGYDWGGSVTAQLGHRYAEHVTAVHLASPLTLGAWHTERPHVDILGGVLAAGDPRFRAEHLAWEKVRAPHLVAQLLDPQTLAYGLHDSPAALLAWLAQRRFVMADLSIPGNTAVDPDDLITLAMLSWVTGSAGSSLRYYREASLETWTPAHDRTPVIEPPAGLSVFRHDLPLGFDPARLAGYYDLVHVVEHDKGGHYPSLEAPALLADDISHTFGLVLDRV